MKIEKISKGFKPFKISVETKEEAIYLFQLSNISTVIINDNMTAFILNKQKDSKIVEKFSMKFFDIINNELKSQGIDYINHNEQW